MIRMMHQNWSSGQSRIYFRLGRGRRKYSWIFAVRIFRAPVSPHPPDLFAGNVARTASTSDDENFRYSSTCRGRGYTGQLDSAACCQMQIRGVQAFNCQPFSLSSRPLQLDRDLTAVFLYSISNLYEPAMEGICSVAFPVQVISPAPTHQAAECSTSGHTPEEIM